MYLNMKYPLTTLICTLLFCAQKPLHGELTDISLLAEHLGGQRYGLLHSTLRNDAKELVKKIDAKERINLEEDTIRLRILLLSALERLPQNQISNKKWTEKHRDFLQWLFANPDALAMLATEIRKEDQGLSVLETWATLWKHETTPEYRDTYAPLALSLALIYDQPRAVPKSKDQNYNPQLDLIERYEFFRDSSKDKKLDTPIERMSVRDLLNVVDLNISKDEIKWVYKHIRSSRKNAGEEYQGITYLMERAVNHGYSPYSSYIMSEIKKHGGICGDQSHFSMNAAKARGIPAATIVGTGNRGAHAWLGYMPDDNEWSAYGSQGITNGRTYSSQRGKKISFRQLHLESHENYQPATRLPVLLKLEIAYAAIRLEQFDVARSLITEAKGVGKMNRDIWEAEKLLLERSKASTEEWKAFLDSLEKNYDDFAHVKEWSLKLKIRHLFAKLPEEERMREIRSVARELGSEESALITVVDRVANMLVKQDATEEVKALYKRCFRKYGEDLELFTKLMTSFVKHGSKLPELKPLIPSVLHTSYKRVVESNSKEYFRADMELNILKKIIAIYQRLGTAEDASKIARLKKNAANRKKKISRAAL